MSTSAMVPLQTGNKHTIGLSFQNIQQIPGFFDNLKIFILLWRKKHAMAPSEHLVMIGMYSPGVNHRQNRYGNIVDMAERDSMQNVHIN